MAVKVLVKIIAYTASLMFESLVAGGVACCRFSLIGVLGEGVRFPVWFIELRFLPQEGESSFSGYRK